MINKSNSIMHSCVCNLFGNWIDILSRRESWILPEFFVCLFVLHTFTVSLKGYSAQQLHPHLMFLFLKLLVLIWLYSHSQKWYCPPALCPEFPTVLLNYLQFPSQRFSLSPREWQPLDPKTRNNCCNMSVCKNVNI